MLYETKVNKTIDRRMVAREIFAYTKLVRRRVSNHKLKAKFQTAHRHVSTRIKVRITITIIIAKKHIKES